MISADWIRWSAVPVTVITFFGTRRLSRSCPSPLLHPVLMSTLVIGSLLLLAGLGAAEYRQGARPLTALLDYTVVSLALPLYRQRATLMRSWFRLVALVTSSAFTAIASTLLLARAAGASRQVSHSLAPKSVTTAIAVTVSEHLGGAAAITALAVMVAGVMGAALGPSILRKGGVRSPQAVGLALGAASHALGTARAVELGEEQAAHASVALVLSAVATVLLAPWVVAWLD